MADTPLWRWLLPVLSALAGLLLLAYILPGGPREWLGFVMDRETHPGLFILMMILLPMLGFPISPFLLLAGIKFGPYWASGITGLIFAAHLIMSYLLTHSFLRPQIASLLARGNYRIPELHAKRHLTFSIIFMAIPGLPYTVKNIALATLRIPFLIYFSVGLACNFVLALPFIGLGHTVIENPKYALLFLGVLAGGYAAAILLKHKFTEPD